MDYEPKNIVVCLDGTGNQVESNISNVLKFYRALRKGPKAAKHQVAFYDQGVGTIEHRSTWGRWAQQFGEIWGLATGAGLDRNVLQAYEFIVRHYQEGMGKDEAGERVLKRDRIFIVGYSRGAHTARVLAGFIYNIGLLGRDQMHLAGAALTAYKRTPEREDDDEIEHFTRTLQPLTVAIEFLGAWDTVSSMIVPSKRQVLPQVESLPNTSNNPGVKAFRHAMAIDEARYMFRLDRWKKGQIFKPNRHSQEETPLEQDSKQVWFPGYHGDVGGGNPRKQSGLSQYPLCWMIKEAAEYGLQFTTQTVNTVALGHRWKNSDYYYPKPCFMAPTHSSKKSGWAWLERLPKFARFREWEKGERGARPAFSGLFIPGWEPRRLEEGDIMHVSAIVKHENDDAYEIDGLPREYSVEPHPQGKFQDWDIQRKN